MGAGEKRGDGKGGEDGKMDYDEGELKGQTRAYSC
jgi:hypothetical protein